MRPQLQIVCVAMMILLSGNIDANEVVRISDINTSPISFDGKKVWLRGTVKDPTRIPFLNLKRYVLKDESGEIGILTSEALPDMEKTITIRARVESLAVIGGKPLGMTVVELERRENKTP